MVIRRIREEWVAEYDFILIDSRTGITDIGGICTIHLPDALILIFTSNEQSVEGIKNVVNRVWEKYKLTLDHLLLAVPVPSRFETITENDLSIRWKGIFKDSFMELYQDWLPDKTAINIKCYLYLIFLWFTWLPVVEEEQVPGFLGFAYDLLTKLLSNKLRWDKLSSNDIAYQMIIPKKTESIKV